MPAFFPYAGPVARSEYSRRQLKLARKGVSLCGKYMDGWSDFVQLSALERQYAGMLRALQRLAEQWPESVCDFLTNDFPELELAGDANYVSFPARKKAIHIGFRALAKLRAQAHNKYEQQFLDCTRANLLDDEAILLAKEKMFSRSRQAINKALHLMSYDANLYSLYLDTKADISYAQGRLRETSRLLKEAIRVRPGQPNLHNMLRLAEVYFQLGDNGRARVLLAHLSRLSAKEKCDYSIASGVHELSLRLGSTGKYRALLSGQARALLLEMRGENGDSALRTGRLGPARGGAGGAGSDLEYDL
jgi:tetratricopeptide (TPR) repeat protein